MINTYIDQSYYSQQQKSRLLLNHITFSLSPKRHFHWMVTQVNSHVTRNGVSSDFPRRDISVNGEQARDVILIRSRRHECIYYLYFNSVCL